MALYRKSADFSGKPPLLLDCSLPFKKLWNKNLLSNRVGNITISSFIVVFSSVMIIDIEEIFQYHNYCLHSIIVRMVLLKHA